MRSLVFFAIVGGALIAALYGARWYVRRRDAKAAGALSRHWIYGERRGL